MKRNATDAELTAQEEKVAKPVETITLCELSLTQLQAMREEREQLKLELENVVREARKELDRVLNRKWPSMFRMPMSYSNKLEKCVGYLRTIENDLTGYESESSDSEEE